jgi:hypothetical protein
MVVFFLRASQNSSTHFVTILTIKPKTLNFTQICNKNVFLLWHRENTERKLTGRSGKSGKSEVQSCSAFCSMDALSFTLPCANFKGSPKVKLRRSGATVDNVDGSVFCKKGNSSCSCDLSNEVAAFHQTNTIKSGLFCVCVDKPKNSSHYQM